MGIFQEMRDRLGTPSAPMPTSDYTPGLVPLAPGGVTLAPGEESEIITALPARVKISVNLLGAAGGDPSDDALVTRLFLGFDSAASGDLAGFELGEWIEIGGRWEEYYSGSVRARNTSTVPVRVTWQEWTA